MNSDAWEPEISPAKFLLRCYHVKECCKLGSESLHDVYIKTEYYPYGLLAKMSVAISVQYQPPISIFVGHIETE